MALTPINLGSAPNDGKGDNLRTAGQKINENFAVVEAALGTIPTGIEGVGARSFPNVDTLLANTQITYKTGSNQVVAGNIIRTLAEGFAYRVAASGVSNHHVTTIGGVKLYVLPSPDGSICPEMFGAKSDGTDTKTQLQAFFTALRSTGFKKARLTGDYAITGTLHFHVDDGVEIDATGAHFRRVSGDSGGGHIIRMSGRKDLSTSSSAQYTKNLTADASSGEFVLTVNNTSSLAAGMVVVVSSQQYLHEPAMTSTRRRETNRIRGVSGTSLYLDAPVLYAYTNAGHVGDGGSSGGMEVRAWNVARNVVWRGGTFHGSSNSVYNFVAEFLSDVLIENCTFMDAAGQGAGLCVRWCAGDLTRNCRSYNHGIVNLDGMYGSGGQTYGYGFLHVDNAFSRVEHCMGGRGWHTFDAGNGQRDITYESCKGLSDTYSFSTHQGTILARYYNCTAEGKSGYTVRSSHVEIYGGSVTINHLHGIGLTRYTRTAVIDGVTFHAPRAVGTMGKYIYGDTGNPDPTTPQHYVIERCSFPLAKTGIDLPVRAADSMCIFRHNRFEVDPSTPRSTQINLKAGKIVAENNIFVNSREAILRLEAYQSETAEIQVVKNMFHNRTNLENSHFLELRGAAVVDIIDNDVLIYGGRSFLRIVDSNNVTIRTLKGNLISGVTSASNAWTYSGSTSAFSIQLSLNNVFRHMSSAPFDRTGLTVTTSHNDWFPGFRGT